MIIANVMMNNLKIVLPNESLKVSIELNYGNMLNIYGVC